MGVTLMGPATGLTKSKLQLATATEPDVLEGKTFYGGDTKDLRIGTMPNWSTLRSGAIGFSASYPNMALCPGTALQIHKALDGNNYISICPPLGYYPGNGRAYVGSLASNFGDAGQSVVLTGTTYTSSKGVKLNGTMPDNSGWIPSAGSFDSFNGVTIPKGFHDGTGVIKSQLHYQKLNNGTASTYFNVANEFSNYKSLANENFLVYSVGRVSTGNSAWHHIGGWVRSWNASTGIFTCGVTLEEYSNANGGPSRYAYAPVSVCIVY